MFTNAFGKNKKIVMLKSVYLTIWHEIRTQILFYVDIN